MFRLKKGKRKSFADLAAWHYEKLVGLKPTDPPTYYAHSIKDALDICCTPVPDGSHAFFLGLQADSYKILKEIITGKPDILKKHSEDFIAKVEAGTYPDWYQTVGTKTELTDFGKRIKSVFDYQGFSRKSATYSAYDFCDELGIDVCPYCNRNYTYTLLHYGNGIVRPELDHYVEKSRHPILALSFYNLIPSCHVCNSSLKHAKPYNFDDFLHPYLHSFHDCMVFSVKFKKKEAIEKTIGGIKEHFGVDFFFGATDVFDLEIKPKDQVGADLTKRAEGHKATFKLEKIYEAHKDMVADIIQSAFIYNEDYVDQLFKDFGGVLFRTRDDVYQTATSNYHDSEHMPKRPFSKLTHDIALEFGLGSRNL